MRLSPSLHRLGTSSLVNSYLVEDAGEITVVDAGLPGHWKDLLAELDSMGRSLDDVRALLLTHGDADHIGFAERLRRERGVKVWISEADAPQARGEAKKPSLPREPMRLGPMLRFFAYGMSRGGLRSTPIAEVETFSPGATLDVPGAPRVIALPGHTPGSVAFHVPSLGALFVGDAMATLAVTTGVTGPAIAPYTVDRARALASLDALDGLEARWTLPGHGDPWTGDLSEALRRIRAGAAPPEARAA
jgi:glyoxylase-like metal-dependent hydrolase (beta-lactamase superfamily II)